MRTGEVASWLFGTGILAAVSAVWLWALGEQLFDWRLVAALWLSPFVAGFLVSLFSPRRKMLLGASMAIPATCMAGLLNWFLQRQGTEVDFPGFEGGVVLLAIVFLGAAVLSVLGAMIGKLVSSA